METIEQLVRTGKATVVDVRTPQEYTTGHVKGSINIPLHEVPNRVDEIKEMNNIVLCCASGGRSARCADFLRRHGIECLDGGPWTLVNLHCN